MANQPDDIIVTGPDFVQTVMPALRFTPPGGVQSTMGDMMAHGVRTVQTGITASTTHTIAGATAMTGGIVTITTCANATDAVKLLAASASTVGQAQLVINNGAKAADIYPAEATTKIDGGAAGSPVALTNTKNATFYQTDATNWISIQGGVKSA